jgi:cytoskeletal protein CcmA (bactofilin family)
MLFKAKTTNRNVPAARRNVRNAKAAAPSILSEGVKVDGDFITEGDLYVGGSVKGRVVARKLTIAENASVDGIVEVDTAIVAGKLSGKVAAVTVSLKRTAHVTAEITHVSLTIEPGSCFEGFSRHVDSIGRTQAMPIRIEADKIAPEPPRLTALPIKGSSAA